MKTNKSLLKSRVSERSLATDITPSIPVPSQLGRNRVYSSSGISDFAPTSSILYKKTNYDIDPSDNARYSEARLQKSPDKRISEITMNIEEESPERKLNRPQFVRESSPVPMAPMMTAEKEDLEVCCSCSKKMKKSGKKKRLQNRRKSVQDMSEKKKKKRKPIQKTRASETEVKQPKPEEFNSVSKNLQSFSSSNLRKRFESLISQISEPDEMISSDSESPLDSGSASANMRLLNILKNSKKLQRMLLEDDTLMIAITQALEEKQQEQEEAKTAGFPSFMKTPIKPGNQSGTDSMVQTSMKKTMATSASAKRTPYTSKLDKERMSQPQPEDETLPEPIDDIPLQEPSPITNVFSQKVGIGRPDDIESSPFFKSKGTNPPSSAQAKLISTTHKSPAPRPSPIEPFNAKPATPKDPKPKSLSKRLNQKRGTDYVPLSNRLDEFDSPIQVYRSTQPKTKKKKKFNSPKPPILRNKKSQTRMTMTDFEPKSAPSKKMKKKKNLTLNPDHIEESTIEEEKAWARKDEDDKK